MPFPLAHPAAVLPLRPLCPRRLNFPALVIGSLVPDTGYPFEAHHVAEFSHRFVAGAFGYDLPLGYLIWLGFYGGRRLAIGLLPYRYRKALWPMCRPPESFTWMIAVSLLIGTWTHLSLDSITHGDGWMVEHLSVLRHAVPWAGKHWLPVYEVLYNGCTWFGSGWLALCYLDWQEHTFGPSGFGVPAIRWACAILFATATLALAEACRGGHGGLGLSWAAMLTLLLISAFVAATALGYENTPA